MILLLNVTAGWSTIIKVQSQNSRKFDKIISNESEEEQ